MERFPVIGFDYPLPPAGVSIRHGHRSTLGLRALLVPDGGRGVRLYDPVRDLFTPIGDGTHGAQIPTATGLIGFTTINDVVQIAPDSSALLSTSQVTLLLVRRKMDSTARAACHIGVDDAPGTLITRCNAYVPFNDGTVKWTFGGSTDGTTKVTISGLTFTAELPEAWAFVAGPNGMAVYLNGVLLGSHTTPAARTAATEPFTLNQGGTSGVTGDITEVSFVAVLDAEWNEAQVKEWSANQAVMFAPAISRRHFLMAEPPPGVFSVTIDGEDITDAIRLGDEFQTPQLDFERGSPGSLRFDIETDTKPVSGAEVIAWNRTGTKRAFGGLVETAVPIVMSPGVSKCYRVEALSFERVFDFFYWTKQYTDDTTPLQVLRDLWDEKDLEAEYGLVLDETVAEGDPITAPFGWTDAKGAQVKADLEKWTQRVGTVSPRKTFSFTTPGTVTASVTISTTNLNYSAFRVNPSKQLKANTVIGTFGPTGGESATLVEQVWIAALGQTVFSIRGYNIPVGSNNPFVVRVGVNFYDLVQYDASPGPNDIVWDPTVLDGTATFNGTSAALVSEGDEVALGYWAKYPFRLELTNGGTPKKEYLVKNPDVEHYAQGLTETQAALDQLDQDPEVFEIDTLEDGLELYQLLPIDVPEADADATEGIVTGMRALLHSADPDNPNEGSYWEYTLTVEETDGQPLQADVSARYRQALRSVL